MARVQKAATATPRLDEHWHKRLREAAFLLLLPLAIYLFACFASYAPSDPGWSHAGDPTHGIHNFGGAFGAWIGDLTFYLIGLVAYAFPVLLLVVGG
ncbi:MAG: DNA translocase FtsK 4TM domain-containing protein, partial [Dokdonella sp.]